MPETTANGEPIDWRELTRHAEFLARGYYRIDHQEQQDLAAESVAKLWRSTAQIEDAKDYLSRIVLNGYIDIYRKRQRLIDRGEYTVRLPEPDEWFKGLRVDPHFREKPRDIAYEVATNESMGFILAQVPENHLDLFLEHLGGTSSQILAEKYGYASAASVNQTVSRIKRTVRQNLEASGIVPKRLNNQHEGADEEDA